MAFNLVTEPWIPVLRCNGRAERVGIRAALAEAGSIRQIAASNPMDNVALLRFLSSYARGGGARCCLP
ncbi:MAG: type I-E CRISPR-associated protein Cse1/CasA [Phycisphaeraceae bacterium]|nr:type I-E CRISPR-associated protein Cse1/CasA [Phycisphaeraceae bacterium]